MSVKETPEQDNKLYNDLKDFILTYHDKDKKELKYKKQIDEVRTGKESIEIDATDLLEAGLGEIYENLVNDPDDKNGVFRTLQTVIKDLTEEEIPIRFSKLVETHKIRELTAEDADTLVEVSGIAIRVSEVKDLLIEGVFQCQKCGHIFIKKYEEEEEGLKYTPPAVCENPACGTKIKGALKLLRKESKFLDWQKITLQEEPEELAGRTTPRPLDVIIKGIDLIDLVKSGERVKIIGILRGSQERGSTRGLIRSYKRYNSCFGIIKQDIEDIQITDEDEKKILKLAEDPFIVERIIDSLFPFIKGYDEVKEAISLQIFEGTPCTLEDGTIMRGIFHILLAGDPAVAKSRLLRRVARFTPRAVFSSGKGISAAGLTAAVIRDEMTGDYVLEAGILVIANGSLACIDEKQLIPTNRGMIPIKDVMEGDVVINYGIEKRGRVQKKSYMGKKKTLQIQTYIGDTINCTPDHKILTNRGWVRADNLTRKDYVRLPILYNDYNIEDRDKFERGFIVGYALSDMWINEKSPKNSIGFHIAETHQERAEYVSSLIFNQYNIRTHTYKRPSSVGYIHGNKVNFGPTILYHLSSKNLKRDLMKVFKGKFPMDDKDYCAGLLCGVLSVDSCVSHKKGTYGIKHEIVITLGRKKYDDEWLSTIYKMITTIFSMFGILATVRKTPNGSDRISIPSLSSYNQVVKLFGEYVVGRNKDKLYSVVPKKKLSSYDCLLDEEYTQWFKNIKFNTSKTVSLYLHSRIWYACKHNLVTTYLMGTLKKYWNEITEVKYREPKKDYLLIPIVSIEEDEKKRVYDLSIGGDHNFCVSGAVVHNCIDEIDKMRKEDRSALHEAMESQVISIAKAGIISSLPASTSILASGNPKLGRFDKSSSLISQIDLPPTLLSRFDLIFVMLDVPDESQDKEIADHLLTARRTHSLPATAQTRIDEDLLVKYILYAKKNYKPILTEDTQKMLTKYYTSLRGLSQNDSSIPITPRQVEAMGRLCESRAKMRLHKEVDKEDAKDIINLYKTYLYKFGVDIETGKLDIDVIMTGKPKSQRDRLIKLLDIISELDKGQGTSLEDILQEGEREGMDKNFIRRAIEEYKQKGDLYEPSPNKFKVLR